VDTRRLAAATRIDLPDFQRRILPVPAPPRDYVELAAGEPGVVYVRTIEWPPSPGASPATVHSPLIRIDLSKPREETKLLDDVDWFQVGGGGKDIVYRLGSDTGWLHLRSDGAADTLAVAIDSARIDVDPPVEWRQIVREAWRQMRDTFYDPALHGRDWVALERETAAYLPGITRRQDLNTLLRRMLYRYPSAICKYWAGTTETLRALRRLRPGIWPSTSSPRTGSSASRRSTGADRSHSRAELPSRPSIFLG
jgi:tricorn protease